MKQLILNTFLIIGLLGTGSHTVAKPNGGGKGKLIWGFSEYAPFKIKQEDGTYSGIDVYILEEIASQLGLELEIVECPFKRCLKYIETGRVDVMTALGLRPEREVFVDYVYPPYYSKNAKAFYTKKGSSVHIKKYEDIYDYRIGVKNGVRYFPRFDTDPKIVKESVNTVPINMSKLVEGRVDAIINTEIQMDYLIIKHDFVGKFNKAPYAVEKGRDFIGVSKKTKHPGIKEKIEKIVLKMVVSGAVDVIINKFFADITEQMKAQKPSEPKKPSPPLAH
jgi:polar amino acid transport system substrate-binding protein